MEILRNRKTGKYDAKFVTTMEAAKRARILKEPIVKTDHGQDWQYITYLCINDTISIEEDGRRNFYRIQGLDPGQKRVILRFHNAATLSNKSERRLKTISVLMRNLKMQKESVDALGYLRPPRK